MYFFPKDDNIRKVLERLARDSYSIIDSKLAQDFGRNGVIRDLRRRDNIFISHDKKKHRTVIALPYNVRVRKKKNGFWFDFLLKL